MVNLQMIMNNYFMLAKNDYLYLQYGKNTGLYNNIAIQSQQVVEKYLKHLVDTFCVDNPEANNTLKTHNLIKIYKILIDSDIDLKMNKGELSLLKDFYFNARYPGDDFIEVTKDEANDCLSIVEEVKQKVEDYLAKNGYCSKCGSKFLSTGSCSCENGENGDGG